MFHWFFALFCHKVYYLSANKEKGNIRVLRYFFLISLFLVLLINNELACLL